MSTEIETTTITVSGLTKVTEIHRYPLQALLQSCTEGGNTVEYGLLFTRGDTEGTRHCYHPQTPYRPDIHERVIKGSVKPDTSTRPTTGVSAQHPFFDSHTGVSLGAKARLVGFNVNPAYCELVSIRVYPNGRPNASTNTGSVDDHSTVDTATPHPMGTLPERVHESDATFRVFTEEERKQYEFDHDSWTLSLKKAWDCVMDSV
jgi:hypothetical protein